MGFRWFPDDFLSNTWHLHAIPPDLKPPMIEE